MDDMYIRDEFIFGKGYVRAIVTRFWKGTIELRQFREDKIALVENTTNAANISDIR